MDGISSQKLVSEISTYVYRIDVLLCIAKDAETNEIRLNLIKARDCLQSALDLIGA